MRKTKRFAAAVAALAMAVSMATALGAVTVSAAATDVTIQTDATDPHSYTAYQVFVGNVSTLNGDKVILPDSELALGAGINAETFYEQLNITDNAKKNPANALEELSKLPNDIALNAIKESLNQNNKVVITNGQDSTLKTGYVYIAESDNAETGDILKIAKDDNLKITPKFGKPTVEKKVKENTRPVDNTTTVDYNYGDGYNDIADYSIGDTVPFTIVGTLPADISSYTTGYYYKFSDRLGKGFKTPTNFKIEAVNGETRTDITEEAETITPVENADKSWKIDIEFKNLKNCGATINASTKIVVTYNAVLDDDADLTKRGNTNEVSLRYSNDYTYDGNGFDDEGTEDEKTDDTKKDGVAVFTYTIDFDKVETGTENKINGAYFALYNDAGQIAKIDDNGIAKFNDVSNENTVEANKFEMTDAFAVKGLDSGNYRLVEVTAPEGYVAITDAIVFEVKVTDEEATTTYVNNSGTWEWTNDKTDNATSAWTGNVTVDETNDAIAFVVDNDNAISAKVGNAKGINLPETGGIGTTMFYVGGGALAAVAGTVLIAKKRAKKED